MSHVPSTLPAPPPSPLATQRLHRLQAWFLQWRLQQIAQGQPGGDLAFATHLGISKSHWSQLKAGRPLGPRLARRLEQAAGLPSGWLDQADNTALTPQPPPQPTRLSATSMLQLLPAAQVPAGLLAAFGPGAALAMPQVEHNTPAGFPSPAADFDTQRVDLMQHMGLDQPSTFLARVRGQSMVGKGIDDGDLLVINRQVEPRHGHTVVAIIDNELTCKTLYRRGKVVKLQAANPDFPDIVPRDGQTLTIWGVVTSVVKRLPI